MRYVALACASVLVSMFYFVVLNFSQSSWIPVQLIFILLVVFNLTLSDSFFSALVVGFLTDLHFTFIGPYMLFFLSIVLTLKILQARFFDRKNLLASFLLTCVAILQYYTLTVGYFIAMRGYDQYAHVVGSVIRPLTMAVLILGYVIGLQSILLGIRSIKKNERQPF